jgi:hypothetical protein
LRYLPNGAEALGNEMAVSSKMHLIMTLAVVFFLIDPVLGQDLVPNANDVQQGHTLAISLCGICHVAAPDQPYKPKMKPSVPSFASIIRKKV